MGCHIWLAIHLSLFLIAVDSSVCPLNLLVSSVHVIGRDLDIPENGVSKKDAQKHSFQQLEHSLSPSNWPLLVGG